MLPRSLRPGALVVFFLVAGAGGAARAQGLFNFGVSGALDLKFTPQVSARVGVFSSFQIQGGFDYVWLRGGTGLGDPHPGPTDGKGTRYGDYNLAVGTLGISPYFAVRSTWGVGVRAAVGAGVLLSPDPPPGSDCAKITCPDSKQNKFAMTVEIGPVLHWWVSEWFGVALEVDYRLLYVNGGHDWLFPETSNDIVIRLWFELALPGH